MDDKQKLQLKHKDKLKGAFTHEEVKEKLKKRCIDAIKEKRKNDIEKARNNNNNRTATTSNVNTNIKLTLQDELMKLKNENNHYQNNTVNNNHNNNSELTTPSSSNTEMHYGNSIEFEDLDFEINEDDIFDANREVENNIDQISNGQDGISIRDNEFEFMFKLSPEEELQLLAEIENEMNDSYEDESVKLYNEMETLQNQEIEYFISTNK